ncbi:MAG: shikimate dehydrogenase [Gammaproteobacteria bacterium]|nr:shikimate dehydrogenase [Gammaproteobacteria bacterium]MDH5304492.1 shikimate dehydrogenase [Gammaproteobacteria bacterium]MDH5321965.1 shikimate dehydrogenase [Gammaproteobacteria bacterium]
MHEKTITFDRYGVMGYPISHSRSPVIHRLFALQTGQNIQYELLQVSADKLETAVRQFQRTGGKGLNVTVPHKRAVAKLADHISERARTAGAVNTLSFIEGEIHGDNTDGIGLLRDLVVNLGLNLDGANILILGAGGATSGIVGPLLEMEPAMIRIANRTLDRAEEIVSRFKHLGPVSACHFNAVPVSTPYDLVINATSAGVKGEAPPYPAAAINETTFCYDLSYGLTPTPFSVWAREHGAAKSVMGWGMLVEQAAESFHIWRHVMPDTAPVLKQMSISA